MDDQQKKMEIFSTRTDSLYKWILAIRQREQYDEVSLLLDQKIKAIIADLNL
jgi:hypothetical protein